MSILSGIIRRFLIASSASILFLVLTVSCVSVNEIVKTDHVRIYNSVPYKSFVRVHTLHKIIATGCEDKDPECEKIVKSLPVIKRPGIGSGSIINTKKGKVIMTAAHVCLSPTINETKHKNHTIKLKNETDISVSYFKTKKIKAKIVKIDKQKDLCLLYCDYIPYEGINVSTVIPKIGDRVYVVSAPFNVQGPELNLIFSGHYSGRSEDFHYYTVTTRPGSSGSVVMNEKYQAIGTLNVAITHLENVGLGEGHKSIKEFIESY